MPSSCVVTKTPFVHDGCTADPEHWEYTYHRQGACAKHKKMSQRYACREETLGDPSSLSGEGRDPCPKCDVERRKRRLQSPHLHKNRNKPSTVNPRKKDSISCCTVM